MHPFNLNDLDLAPETRNLIRWHLERTEPGTNSTITETSATAAALNITPAALTNNYNHLQETHLATIEPIPTPAALASYQYQRVTFDLDALTQQLTYKQGLGGIIITYAATNSPELLELPHTLYMAHLNLLQLCQIHATGGTLTPALLAETQGKREYWYTAPAVLQQLTEHGLLAQFKEPLTGQYLTYWHTIAANCALKSPRPDKTTATALLGLTSTPLQYWQLTPRAAAAKNIAGIEHHTLPLSSPELLRWSWQELTDETTTT